MHTVVLPSNRDYKPVIVPDTHMRDREFSNTTCYVPHQENCIQRLIEGGEKGIFDTVVFTGDLFDTEYEDVGKTLYHITLFSRLYEVMEGRVFKVMGNHTLNKGKAKSLAMFLSGKIKSARIGSEHKVIHKDLSHGIAAGFELNHPVLNVVDRIVINGTVINCFHYSRFEKNYYDPLTDLDFKPNTHIGVYHDHIVSNRAKQYILELANDSKFAIPGFITIENSQVLSNIDYAVVGDIHTKVGEFKYINPETGREVNVDIPGSIGRTQNNRAQQHDHVMLPLFHIPQSGPVVKSHIRFDLLDYRKIFRTELLQESKAQQAQLKDFNRALNLLQAPMSLEEAVAVADIHSYTKELILTSIKGHTPQISYRQSEENLRLLEDRTV